MLLLSYTLLLKMVSPKTMLINRNKVKTFHVTAFENFRKLSLHTEFFLQTATQYELQGIKLFGE